MLSSRAVPTGKFPDEEKRKRENEECSLDFEAGNPPLGGRLSGRSVWTYRYRSPTAVRRFYRQRSFYTQYVHFSFPKLGKIPE
jgi:hypothetical protein